MKKLTVLLLCLSTSACMMSRQGIKTPPTDWIWNPVNFCDNYPNCTNASTYLVGQLHYYSNYMQFQVVNVPTQAAEITYRILAQRPNETLWHLMIQMDAYSQTSLGYTQAMSLTPGQVFDVQPDTGYIEQYNHWIIETEQIENPSGGAPIAVGYGLGYRLVDVTVTYSEANQTPPTNSD